MTRPSAVLRVLEPAASYGGRALAIGASRGVVRALRGADWAVTEHALDRNPMAAPRGERFVPPVTPWPVPTGAFDAVLLLDELALVVDDEAAPREVARALRPGGALLLRVPNAGPLAWLDGFNLYRYARDVTKIGPRLEETRAIGWRRHYRRSDVRELLGEAFRIRRVWTEGIGLAEIVRLALLLPCRAVLRTRRCDPLARRLTEAVEGWEAAIRPGPWGTSLVVVAERKGTESPASRARDPRRQKLEQR